MASASGGTDYGPDDDGSRFRTLDTGCFPPIEKRQRKRNITVIDPRTGFVLLDKQLGEFWIVKSADNRSLEKVSCFFLGKALTNHIGDGHVTKRLRDGSLLVKCKNDTQTKKLLNLRHTLLGETYKVTVEENVKLNSVQGVVYCWDSKYLSEEEILEGLQDEKVIEVRKVKRMVSGVLTNTALCILTFKRSILPESIKFGFHEVLVKEYIPAPFRCFNCFRFGHSKKVCKNDRVCANCSLKFDENHECKTPTKCVNCHGAHNSTDKSCPRYVRENSIQKIKTQDKITYFEARNKFQSFYPRDNKLPSTIGAQNHTYAEITASTSNSTKKPFTFTAKQTPTDNISTRPNNTQPKENSALPSNITKKIIDQSNNDNILLESQNILSSAETSQSHAPKSTNNHKKSTVSPAQSPKTQRNTRSNKYSLSPSGGAIRKYSNVFDHSDMDETI